MDTGSRLTCLTIVLPSSLIKELKHPFQDSVQEESEESSAQVQLRERNETAPSTSGKETIRKRRHKEEVSEKTSTSQAEASTKQKRDMKSLVKRASRSRTLQVAGSEVKAKQGKLSRRRLLLRKKCSLKRLGYGK